MFIEEYRGLVSADLCEQIIARFEASPGRRPSMAKVDGVPIATPDRSGTQLACTPADWKDLIDPIIPALHASLNAYAQKHPAVQMLIKAVPLSCTIPLIERVDPGQGFNWHFDQSPQTRDRAIAGLLYLRTVQGGGGTEFREQGCEVQPEAGKIVLFPPFWTHLHRGVTPDQATKYVMSFFWIYPA